MLLLFSSSSNISFIPLLSLNAQSLLRKKLIGVVIARLITGAINAGICKIEISRYSSAEDNKSPVAPYAK